MLRASAGARGAVLLLLAACSPAPDVAPPPNVVLVVLDTTRADRCSLLGYARPTTPYLERLAAESVTYRNCWAPSSWTGPSHASLFTGLRPEHHHFLRGAREWLDAAETTLAERLAAAGYRTAGFSNNPNVSRVNGLAQGFEEFAELSVRSARGFTTPEGYVLPQRDAPSSALGHRQALAWARERMADGEPFFLFVNDMEPHLPYAPAEDLQTRFTPPGAIPSDLAWGRAFRFPQSVGYCFGEEQIGPERLWLLGDLYDAEIATLDREIERLVEGLREMGALANTLLVVTSDHGENLGDHGLLDHLFSLHASLTRVPLLVRHPDGRDAGAVVDDVVRLTDIAPTALAVCNLPPPAAMDGRSLLADLPGRTAYAALGGGRDEQAEFFGHLFPDTDVAAHLLPHRAVFDGRFHFLRRGDGHEECYDLTTDPAEQHDLAPTGSPELSRLRTLLERVYPRNR